MSNIENINVLKRFLLSRAESNENAGMLADMIESGRNIDAVLLDDIEVKSAKNILEYGELSFYLVDINDHIIALYPTDEKEKYMKIKDFFDYGEEIVTKSPFSYSEAITLKEFLDAAGVKYYNKNNDDGLLLFGIAKKDELLLNKAINLMVKEEETDIGAKHYSYQNICFAHIAENLNQIILSSSPALVGNTTGSCCMKVLDEGILVINPKKACRLIDRNDKDFKNKVLDTLLKEMQGDREPVKFIFGDLAKTLSEDITLDNLGDKYMTKNDALNVFNLSKLPTIQELSIMINKLDTYNKKQKKALLTLMRMSICSSKKILDAKELSFTKEEKAAYKKMHNKNLNLMTSYNKNQIRNNKELGDEER